jgi:hypothetical protein
MSIAGRRWRIQKRSVPASDSIAPLSTEWS